MHRLIFILFFAGSIALNAQITVLHKDIIQSGQKVLIALDGKQQKFASIGQNQVWDYQNLKADNVDSLHFGLNYWYKGYTNFPNSNFAYVNYSDSQSISFMHLNDTSFGFDGYYNYTTSSEDISRSNATLIKFPSTYNSKFNESELFPGGVLRIKLDPDTAGPLPFIDSIRIDQTRFLYSNIDGWGILKTPLGQFPSIRQTILEVIVQTYMMKSSGTWKNAPNNAVKRLQFPEPNFDSSYNVNFWTNDKQYGYPILFYYYTPRDTAADVIQWMYQKPKTSGIVTNGNKNVSVYPNPANNIIYINGDIENVMLEIWDTHGRCINKYAKLDTSLSIEDLEMGFYVLKFQDTITGENLSNQTLVKF